MYSRFLKASAFLPILTLLSFSLASANDTEAKPLAHLRTLNVLVEDVSSNDCNITKDDLSTTLRYTLSQSKFKVDSAAYGDIYLNLTVLDDCHSANIRLSVEPVVQIVESKLFHIGSIWENSFLLEGTSDHMRQRVLDDVETLAKKFVVDWSSVNP